MDDALREKAFRSLEETFANRFRRYAPGKSETVADGPIASVLPQNAEEVELLTELAARHSLPLAARGASTALYSGAARGVVDVRFDLMRGMRLPESGEDWVEVEPGITWMVLEDTLRATGKSPTVYPTSAPRATVGGWLAENGLGVGSFEYGWLLENVLSVEVVLAGGERTTVRSVDLRRLVGSRGNVGFIVGARLATRAADKDVPVAAAFRTAENLAGAVLDLYWARAPLWHAALLNPRMARARNLEENYVLFGAYPGERAARVGPDLRKALESHGGRFMSQGDAGRIWEERFFPVSPLGPTPAPGRALVSAPGLAPTLRRLEKNLPGVALQGTIARDGEIWLLAFETGRQGEGLLDLSAAADDELLRVASESWRYRWR